MDFLGQWVSSGAEEAHYQLGIPTLKRLAGYGRQEFMEAVDAANTVVSSSSQDRSDIGCHLTLLLPHLLAYPTRNGGVGSRRVWKNRFDRFWEGKWGELLEEACTRVPARRPPDDPATVEDPEAAARRLLAKHTRTANLVKQGELSRAASCLTSSPVAPATLETLEKLQSLHPSEDPLEWPATPAGTPELHVPAAALVEALRKAPRGSAPGVSGWRYEYLKFFLGRGRGSDPAASVPLPSFVDRMLRGDLPEGVRKLLATSRLFALEKSGGGVRPIAVGDTLRRWVTKAVCLHHREDFINYFAPLQMAVGMSSACEKVYRTVSSYMETAQIEEELEGAGVQAPEDPPEASASPEEVFSESARSTQEEPHKGGPQPHEHPSGRGQRRVLLTLDAANAFNSISRQAIFDNLAAQFPELLPFFRQFYGSPAELWFWLDDGSVEVLFSARGTQQGDAAGPFLFCLGLHPVLQGLQEEFPDALIAAYMDDIFIGTLEASMAPIVESADRRLQERMLQLRREKSHAFCPGWDTSLPSAESAAVGIELHADGVIVLGCPLGTEDFMRSAMVDVAGRQKVESLVDALQSFAEFDLQSAWLLLRYCAVPSFTYWCRLLPRHVLADGIAAFDALIQSAASRMAGFPVLDDHHIRQLSLPIRYGGCGLISTASIADAAYATGSLVALNSIWEYHASAPWMPPGDEYGLLSLPWMTACVEAAHRVEQRLGDPSLIGPLEDYLIDPPARSLQHRLSLRLHRQARDDLLASFPSGGRRGRVTRDAARFLSCQGPGAGEFMQAIPYAEPVQLNSGTFRTGLFLHLGLPLPACLMASHCSCGARMDPYGDHLFCCNKGNQWIFRHDSLRGVFKVLLRDANLPVQQEVLLRSVGITLPGNSADDERMDLLWIEDGVTQLGDVSLTHPCRADPNNLYHSGINGRLGRQENAGKAAQDRARSKRNQYGPAAQHSGARFTPLVGETFGRWSPEVEGLLKRIMRKHRRVQGVSGDQREFVIGSLLTRGWRLLSCALVKTNAFLLNIRAQRAHEAENPDHAAVQGEDVWGRGPLHPAGGGLPVW